MNTRLLTETNCNLQSTLYHSQFFFIVGKLELQYRCWIQSCLFPVFTVLCHLFKNRKAVQHNKSQMNKWFYLKRTWLYIIFTELIFQKQILHLLTKIDDKSLIDDINRRTIIRVAQFFSGSNLLKCICWYFF